MFLLLTADPALHQPACGQDASTRGPRAAGLQSRGNAAGELGDAQAPPPASDGRSDSEMRGVLEDLARGWSEADSRLPARADSAVVVRFWRVRVRQAREHLEPTGGPSGSGRVLTAESTPLPPKTSDAAEDAQALLPVLGAIGRGENSAVLVITTVGCECVLAACARMSALWDSLTLGPPGLPVARIDEMAVPDLADAWELYEFPTWVFLDSTGRPVSLLEGNVEKTIVLAELRNWIGPGVHSPKERGAGPMR